MPSVLFTVSSHAWQPSPPRFEVDPLWPKPLPNHWLFGSITGVAVDSQDHIWVVHRGADSLNARTEMGAATNAADRRGVLRAGAAVLEFDQAGTLVGHWGGPGPATTGRDRLAVSQSMHKATSGSRRRA